MTLPEVTLERLDLLAKTPSSLVFNAVFKHGDKRHGHSFAVSGRPRRVGPPWGELTYQVARAAHESLIELCGRAAADDIKVRRFVLAGAHLQAAKLQPDYFAQ